MKKVTVIGLHQEGRNAADGQSVKTRIVTQELERLLGSNDVQRVDTYGWKKHPWKLLFSCVKAVLCSRNVVFMTDAGGINVFPWLLVLSNFLKRTKLHYVVIGGWLIQSLDNDPVRKFWLSKLDAIYVETQTMKSGMEKKGLPNVVIMPNCKRLQFLEKAELTFPTEAPFRLCTFSRVMREKGIEDAVRAVQEINQRHGQQVYSLDIYGQVDADQVEWFERLKREFPQEVRYCGIVPYDQSTSVMKQYFALLFPTKFYTEGIPGTVIDSYAAGVPVISSRWESYCDIVDDETGFGYSFDDAEGLLTVLEDIASNPDLVNDKRVGCLQRAKMYTPESVIEILVSKLR